MATFVKANADVNRIISEVIADFYPDLVEAQARIGAVMAYPTLDEDGDSTGPAMKRGGLAVMAKIKKNGEADRVDGKPDATITLDVEEWDELDEERQRALIDHELYHLIVKRKSLGKTIKIDDGGRPLFDIRPHDWEITGFRVVAERHLAASCEVVEARKLHDRYGTLLFDFASDQARPLPGMEPDPTTPKPRRRAVVEAATR